MEHMEPKGRPFAKKNHLPNLHHTFWAHHLWSSSVFFVRNAVQGSQESGQAHHQEAQGRDETTWASPSSARVGRGNREWTDPSHSAGAASTWRNTPGRFGIPTSTFRCFQAANSRNHIIHPGPWLNTTQESEEANTRPVANNRPWNLQRLDEDQDSDLYLPFVWIPAVDAAAQDRLDGHQWLAAESTN